MSVFSMEKAIQQLESQVLELTKLCGNLHSENDSLKSEHRVTQKECEQLREKNRIARSRVEQIVERLKTVES